MVKPEVRKIAEEYDLITAKNDYASSLALKGIQGNISNFIEDLREE